MLLTHTGRSRSVASQWEGATPPHNQRLSHLPSPTFWLQNVFPLPNDHQNEDVSLWDCCLGSILLPKGGLSQQQLIVRDVTLPLCLHNADILHFSLVDVL